jgi:phospholipase/carboxylesterase
MNEDLVLEAQINLYYDLHLPTIAPAPLLIALHGYGASKRQIMREAKQMIPEGFAIAALQGFHQHMREPKEAGGPARFGFGWLTNFRPEESVAIHHRALLDLIAQLTMKEVVDSQKIFLLGFSQSCALNYRFAFTYPERLRGVIGICGGIPGDWTTSELYQTSRASVFHLAGTRDDFYPPERVQHYADDLRTRAEDVEFRSYDAAHEIVPAMRSDVHAWLERQTA